MEQSDYLTISHQQASRYCVLHFTSAFRKEVIKMELMVSPKLDLLMQSSAFAKDWRVKLMPNGLSFFIFRAFP